MRLKAFLLCSMLLGQVVRAEVAVSEMETFPMYRMYQFGEDIIVNHLYTLSNIQDRGIVRIDGNGVEHRLKEIPLTGEWQDILEDVIKVGDLYYFMCRRPIGRYYDYAISIYVSDGTAGSFELVVDGPLYEPTYMNGSFYYRRAMPFNGETAPNRTPKKLYRYDIATQTEYQIPAIPNEEEADSPYPSKLMGINGKVYYAAYHDDYAYEPFVYDENGPRLIKDINPGAATNHNSGHGFCGVDEYVKPNGEQTHFHALAYRRIKAFGLYWFVGDDGSEPDPYWTMRTTDGTYEGTQSLGTFGGSYLNFGGQVGFPVYDTSETRMFFLWGDGGVNGAELCVSDGTPDNSYMVKDIYPGSASLELEEHELAVHNDVAYFRAHGELWRSDGTEAGTHELFNPPQAEGCEPFNIISANDGYLYFFGLVAEEVTECTENNCSEATQYKAAIFRSDGTEAGTEEIYRDPRVATDLGALRYDRKLAVNNGGIYFKTYREGQEVYCRLHEDQAPEIISQPVVSGETGQLYEYLVQATDPENQPLTIFADILPDWLTLTDNGNGSAFLSGTPTVSGDYQVQITAQTAVNTPAVQQFTIHVTDAGAVHTVRVFSRNETVDPNANYPNYRLYVINEGQETLTDFVIEYYFRVEDGKTPVRTPYYPNTVGDHIQYLGSDYYKIVYYVSGVQVHPGEVFPDQAGLVTGIRYEDWSPVDITNDYSNNQSLTFLENDHICVFDANGELIWGTPFQMANLEPVANAGSDITVVDLEGDGEEVILDGSFSNDPDGSIASYEWLIDGAVVAMGMMPSIVFQIGLTEVTLRVTDFEGATGTDVVNVLVQETSHDLDFTFTPNFVPEGTPVIIQYTVPAAMDGCDIVLKLQRKWDVCPYEDLPGTAGYHDKIEWSWNKSFFGGQGPWEIRVEVNGITVETHWIRFSY